MRFAAALAMAVVLGGCAASPPATPHTISDTGDAWCATCHTEGVGDAPVTPHPERIGCVGCHVPTGTADVGALDAWPPSEVALLRP